MKWPLVSRAKYAECRGLLRDVAIELGTTQRALAEARKQANVADALRREEKWRRLKAEGQLAYVCDRVRRARELMLSYPEEPATAKRKAISE